MSTTGTTGSFPLSSLDSNSSYEVQASLDENFQTGVRSTNFKTHGPPTNLRLGVAPPDGELNVIWTVVLNGGSISIQAVEWK